MPEKSGTSEKEDIDKDRSSPAFLVEGCQQCHLSIRSSLKRIGLPLTSIFQIAIQNRLVAAQSFTQARQHADQPLTQPTPLQLFAHNDILHMTYSP